MKQEEIKKLHPGLFKCPFIYARTLMPEISKILDEFEGICEKKPEDYVVDVKVHMLMPGQYPCIPNWHFDMVPRDENNEQDWSKITNDKMYLWVSNQPYTEFKKKVFLQGIDFESYFIEAEDWVPFTQKDEHRGTVSQEHIWRVFIRCCPTTILKPADSSEWMRRHSQVYLNAENFNW